MEATADNVVDLKPPPADEEPEVVTIDLQFDDVVRMVLGTPVPFAPGSPLVIIEKDLVRAIERPRWNVEELRKLSMQALLQLYSDINWTNENPLGGLALVVPARG